MKKERSFVRNVHYIELRSDIRSTSLLHEDGIVLVWDDFEEEKAQQTEAKMVVTSYDIKTNISDNVHEKKLQ
jgi:hypothetical protein